jgi:hypothetical protein
VNVIPAILESLAKIAPALEANQIYKSTDVLSIWEKIASSLKLSDSVQRNIKHDLSSSVEWQS